MNTKWDLKLFYKSTKDPQIEKDLVSAEKAIKAFAKKYKGKSDYLKNATALLNALKDQEKLETTASSKPTLYFMYIRELNSNDNEAEAQLNKISDRLTKVYNEILFFELNIGKIDLKTQKKFLDDKKLNKYKYYLETVWNSSKYDLSEAEEKILSLKSLTSRSLWISGVEKSINKLTVPFKGKSIPISEAMNIVSNLPTKSRRKLHKDVMEKLYSVSDFSESEINAVYTDKKVNDELRGFKEPYSETILKYENDEKSVTGLVDTVTDQFHISRRFYDLKKKLLGLDHLEYADRSTSIGKVSKEFTFKESVDIVRNAFYNADEKYGKILDRFIENGQIDVFPKTGKSGGAFCSHDINSPTMVLLNHVNDYRSLTTLAHEMGHAIHSERSKGQSPIYESYSTAVAETASTFFESVVFGDVFETLSEKEKIIALHDNIQDNIASIFRQIAVFNFEHDLHKSIREKGSLPKEEIAKLMNQHMKAYIGSSMKFDDMDGYFFVTWSHIRNFFYVYSYTYGQLISMVLHQKYIEDHNYIKEIDKFLSAGGSDTPENIFSNIGVAPTPKLFNSGLKNIENDIIRLEKLVAKKGK